MRTLAATLVALITSSAGRADAQAAPVTQLTHLQVGARVRAHAPTLGARFDGVVVGTSGDTLDLVGDGARVRLPMAAITTLELHRGHNRGEGAKRGAVWGTAVGVALGGVTALLAGAVESGCGEAYTCSGDSETDAADVAGVIGLSAISGALWGAAIGAIIGRDRWDTMAMPAATRTSMTVQPWITPERRVGAMVTLR